MVDLSGLDDFKASDFIDPVNRKKINTGHNGLLMVSIDLIDEDPNQPRKEFNEGKLKELADSILFVLQDGKKRGIKSPLSLKKNGDRYVINHGARRYRAAKLAGLSEVPAFIDEAHTKDDQVIENIQRDNLSVVEIAEYVTAQIKAGKKKKDIAEQLGKPASFVSEHAVFLDFPDCIRSLYDLGNFKSIRALYDLYRQYQNNPKAVEEFCNQEHISTSSIKEFVKELGASSVKKSKNNNPIKTRSEEPTGGKLDPVNSASSESSDGGGTEESTKDTQKNTSESKEKSDPKTESTIIRKPKIVVSIGNETGELVTNRIANEGMVWVDLVGDIAEYPASSIQIITVIESV